jgi:hypothetical protein
MSSANDLKTKFLSLNFLGNLIVAFAVFICIFPTIRLMLFGSRESGTGLELFVSALPEVMMLLIFLFAIFLFGNRYKQSKIPLFDKLMAGFILFNVILGFILSADLKISLYGFRVTYFTMFFYFIGRFFQGYEEVTDAVLQRIFRWLMGFGVLGIIVHFGFPDWERHMIELTGRPQSAYFIPRITSLVWTPVLFGTLMAIASIYFSFRILYNENKWNYAAFTTTWICLFLSVSRGPIIAFLVGLIFLSGLMKKWKSFAKIISIALISASLLSLTLTGSLKMLEWMVTSTAETMTMTGGLSRVERWIITFKDIKERPYGYGLGKAGETAFRFLKDTQVPAAVYSTDGWFFKQCCETGIEGLLTYLILAAMFFFPFMKFAKKNSLTLVSFSTALIVMINAQNVVANTLDFHPFMGIYWMIIGFSVNRIQSN